MLSTCPRTTRDMVCHPVPPIARSSTTNSTAATAEPGSVPAERPRNPSTATASSTTRSIEGRLNRMSTERIISASTRPPAKPATAPHAVPMTSATAAENTPTARLTTPPASTRASMSRPSASVPRMRPGT